MNPFEMVLGIVIVVMIASIIKARVQYRTDRQGLPADPEAERLREEVKMLRDRIAVLERIVTDKESSLEREIERLRDR